MEAPHPSAERGRLCICGQVFGLRVLRISSDRRCFDVVQMPACDLPSLPSPPNPLQHRCIGVHRGGLLKRLRVRPATLPPGAWAARSLQIGVAPASGDPPTYTLTRVLPTGERGFGHCVGQPCDPAAMLCHFRARFDHDHSAALSVSTPPRRRPCAPRPQAALV